MTATQSLTDDGAWCWFQNPRALRHVGANDRTYAGWVTREGHIEVGSFDHDTGTIERTRLEADFEEDDHDAPGLTVAPDGHLIAFYSAHGADEFRYRRSEDPEDASAFGPIQTVTHVSQFTYANPRWIDEDLHVFYRNDAGSLSDVVSPDGGETWSDEREIVTTGGLHWCVYFQISEVMADAVDIAMTFAYGGGNHPHRDVRHVLFDGETLTAADGTALAGPGELEIHEAPLVYDSLETGNDAWVWDCAAGDGRPAIAYAEIRSETEHAYRYARWTGSEWNDRHLVEGGSHIVAGEIETYYSGGVYLDHEEPTVAYASIGDHEGSAIERIVVEGEPRRTRLVDDRHQNVRPIVPRNRHPNLPALWMHGGYDHFADRDYDTAIVSTAADSGDRHR